MSNLNISSVQEDCTFNFALAVISGKWNINIVLELITHSESLSFSEIAQRIPEISPRMLSMRLKSLIESNVIFVIPNPEKPKKVRYNLTDSGKELSKVLQVIRSWSIKYGDCKNEVCLNDECRHGIAIKKLVELQMKNK